MNKVIIYLITFFLVFPFVQVMAQNTLREANSDELYKVISNNFSKEFCSCYYVSKNKEDFCQNYASMFLPVNTYEIDEESKTISTVFLGQKSQASFISKKLGCTLKL